jgi:ornithine--oxo-acid transaminase
MNQHTERHEGYENYEEYVNPQWARLLQIMKMDARYKSCNGAELTTENGLNILDFLSGYCVYNVGHNHPRLIAELRGEIDRCGPTMLQSHVSPMAGDLARRLCEKAGGKIGKVFFASSGSEGVETAIKFAHAHTGRSEILYASNGFYGLTCGALSLMSNDFWKDRFGPFLSNTSSVRFGDLDELENHLSNKKCAAFILEPIQAEGGINVPDDGYLQRVQRLCSKYGTLLVLDEVQTGFNRTGPFLAAHHYGVEPDMVILAKAISGGLVPCSAVLMSDEICKSVYSSLKKAFVHTSTYSENGLAMRTGLTVLDILEDEKLEGNCRERGEELREKLRNSLCDYEMYQEIRGVGLLNGIRFKPPETVRLRLAYDAFCKIHPGMFGQVVVMRLFSDHQILSQICGNQFMTLKAAPPLIVSSEQIDRYVKGIQKVFHEIHHTVGFWSEALGIAARVITSI